MSNRLITVGLAFEVAGLIGTGLGLANFLNDDASYDEVASQVQTDMTAGEISVAEGLSALSAEHNDEIRDYLGALVPGSVVIVGGAMYAIGERRRNR